MEHEELCKKKLQEELTTINETNATIEKRMHKIELNHDDLIESLKREFDEQLNRLQSEHYDELEDEKNATRFCKLFLKYLL